MHKKIALIQPQIPTGNSLGIKKSPESIQSLAGQLSKVGHEVRMFHTQVDDALVQLLTEFNPDVVGISTMTPNFPDGKEIASRVKRIRDDIFTVIGGWHVSGGVQSHIRGQESETIDEIIGPNSPFDCAVIGEGDLVLPEIVKRLEHGKGVEDLDGVVSWSGNAIRINTAKRIEDLDVLSDPSWEGLPINDYRDLRTGLLDLSVHFNRACRYNCGFCSTGTVYGRGVSAFSPNRAVAYIENVLESHTPEVITFTDEDFFANLKWVESLVSLIEERNIHGRFGAKFDTFATINDLIKIKKIGRQDLLSRMKRVGFNEFTIGIESLNAGTLSAYNKEVMIKQTMIPDLKKRFTEVPQDARDTMMVDQHFSSAQEAIDTAHESGILIVGDYILGNMGETEQEVRKGFELFSQLRNLHTAYLPTFTPFPGIQLWEEAYRSGKMARTPKGKIDWAKFNASSGPMDLGYDIEKLRDELEVKFYTSERYREDMMSELKNRPELRSLFVGRFSYLLEKFGDNELVKLRLAELGLTS